MIHKKKKFSWPRKLYDKKRILEENKLKEKYGLKNKREIWKTEAKVKYFRDRAKSLITSGQEEQKIFFNKLNFYGLKVQTIADILALNKEDILKRRLASILVAKGLTNTPKNARQMIVHKKIMINNKVVNVPSYLVKLDEEDKISLRKKVKKTTLVKEDVEKEVKEDISKESKEEKEKLIEEVKDE